jgi:hypothetical protein
LWVRQGSYFKVEHLKGASLGKATALPINIRHSWKGLPGTNTQKLITKIQNYRQKSFLTLEPERKKSDGLNFINIYTIVTYRLTK